MRWRPRTSSQMTTATDVPGSNTSLGQQHRLSRPERRRQARIYKLRRYLVAYGFLAPSLVFFVIFLLIPAISVFWYSLNSGGFLAPQKFVGLRNWTQALEDPLALKSLGNSLKYALITIPTVLILGMVIALLLRNIKRGGAVLRAGLYFPVLAPLVVTALIWSFLVHPDFGAFNLVVRALGGQTVNFLGSTSLALPTISAVEVWRGMGFWAVYFLAALVALPSELYEAAILDGSNSWQRFTNITLPLLRPTILFALVLATVYNLQIFDTVFVLTGGGPANSTATVVWYIWQTLFSNGNVGYGATLSSILLLVILVLTLIQMRLLRGRRIS